MIPEHMHKLRDMSEQYNVRIPDLMTTYSNLQTRYLRRDLDQNKKIDVHDMLECAGYGNKALEVMDRYMRMKK